MGNRASTPDPNFDPAPPSPTPRRVVVCGAGVVGVATSYFLALRGHRVTCVDVREAHDWGTQYCSYRNGGLICPSLASPWVNGASATKMAKSVVGIESPIKLEWRGAFDRHFAMFGVFAAKGLVLNSTAQVAQDLYSLARYSQRHMQPWIEEPAKSGNAKGTLQLCSTQESKAAIEANVQCLKALGCGFESVDEAWCREMVGHLHSERTVAGGVYCETDRSGDVHAFTGMLIQQCKKLGVDFQYGAEVKSVSMHRERVVGVRCADGREFRGDAVVLAMGLGTRRVAQTAGVNVPLLGVRGYCLKVPYANRKHVMPCTVVDDANKLYLCPLGGSITISCRAEIVGEDYSIEVDTAKGILAQASAFFAPGFLDEENAEFHTCLRPISPDDVPIIGPSAEHDNLFVNAGHGSKGWTQAMGSAALLAHLFDGTVSPINPKPYSPSRFVVPHWLIAAMSE